MVATITRLPMICVGPAVAGVCVRVHVHVCVCIFFIMCMRVCVCMCMHTSGTVPVSRVLVSVLGLGAVAGVEEIYVLVVVAAEELTAIVGVDQARDVGSLHLTLRVHLEGGRGGRRWGM